MLEAGASLVLILRASLTLFNFIYDDDEESTIPLNEIISQIPPSIAITPVLPTMEPEDSLNMGDGTIPKKEPDKFMKSSVEDLVLILSESEDTSDNGSDDDESFLEEDVPEENFKTYLNPLFEFDEEYISSDINPLYNEVLEDIENKDSDINVDVSTEIKDGFHDSEGDIIKLKNLLINDTIPNLPPEVFLDIDPKRLNDEPDNDLKSMVKDCPDYEDSRAHGFVHRSLKLQSFACLYMGIRYPRSY
ncbi:hypothetical protein Tco_0304086 [Tanacetum coccineum]